MADPRLANCAGQEVTRAGSYRWGVCALLFFATTINYVDRQVLGILKNELQASIGWNEAQYGLVVTALQAAYAVGLIGLAAAAHQGWSANLFTLVPDMFPRRAVGSVVGIGGMAGAIGGMFIATAAGLILQATGSYVPLLVIAASAYLVALPVIHLLAPRLEPVEPAAGP